MEVRDYYWAEVINGKSINVYRGSNFVSEETLTRYVEAHGWIYASFDIQEVLAVAKMESIAKMLPVKDFTGVIT